ncbi:helix-turn-helix domain-containing protein [Roseovarius sp. C7]|uniref:helix-turn-helix domain-containing protein n=1 Tax=Roseovarius sp. C7 TaxID=3398643 RepID=UPI0039F72412
MSKDFSENLRSLCADRGSIAQVCRDIGVNRQQFNRYLNGTGMPAAHNLRRIARYFGTTEAELMMPHDEFERRRTTDRVALNAGPVEHFVEAFQRRVPELRRYLGWYHAHITSPAWEGSILRSLSCLYERDGYVLVRSIERATSEDGSIVHRTRYNGVVTRRGGRIYILEQENSREASIDETILMPSPRQKVNYLRGMTLGVASRPYVLPYASRSIWKKLPDQMSARDAIAACGALPTDSRKLDPTIRTYLGAGTLSVS